MVFWDLYYCVSASDITLKDIEEIDEYQTKREHKQARTMWISLGVH